ARLRHGLCNDGSIACRCARCRFRSFLPQPARSNRRAGDTPRDAHNFLSSRVRRGWWSDELRRQRYRWLSPGWHLRCRILKGEQPSNLPVQESTKFGLVITFAGTGRQINFAKTVWVAWRAIIAGPARQDARA